MSVEGLALEAVKYLAGDNPKPRAKENEKDEKEQDLAKSKKERTPTSSSSRSHDQGTYDTRHVYHDNQGEEDRDQSVDSYGSSESEEGSSVSDEGNLDRGRSGWQGRG